MTGEEPSHPERRGIFLVKPLLFPCPLGMQRLRGDEVMPQSHAAHPESLAPAVLDALCGSRASPWVGSPSVITGFGGGGQWEMAPCGCWFPVDTGWDEVSLWPWPVCTP